MTIVANILFIIIQIILSKGFNLRESVVQLLITFLFGFLMNFTLVLVQILPAPETWTMRIVFLIISLFVIAIGLLGYFSAKFPLMPYDELTHVISEKFNMKFGKAKITSDLINVGVASLVSLIFIQSLGSIGIGTLVAAYFVGKILGWLMKKYEHHLIGWINKGEVKLSDEIDIAVLEEDKQEK